MPISVRCPHCRADLAVPRREFGRTLPCRACGGAVATGAVPARALRRGPAAPTQKFGAIPRWVGVLAVVLFLGSIGGAVALKFALAKALNAPTPDPEVVPDSHWVAADIPERFHAEFPGPLGKPAYGPMLLGERTTRHGVTKWGRVFGVSVSDRRLPDRLNKLPAAELLGQACDELTKSPASHRVPVVSRGPVAAGPFPGLEYVTEDPENGVRRVGRVLLARERIYVVECSGPGYGAQHADVAHLLDSFAVTAPEPPPRPPILPPPPAYRLPPMPDPLPITPGVTQAKAIRLGEPAGDVRVGGGGRFLILHLPKSQRLALFDAGTGRVARHIPVDELGIGFCAGMAKLVVYRPGAKVFERYDLLSGAKELTAPARGGLFLWKQNGQSDPPELELESGPEVPAGAAAVCCMGHASAGPFLFSVGTDSPGVYDLVTLRAMPVPSAPLPAGDYWAGAPAARFGLRYREAGKGFGVVEFYKTGTRVHDTRSKPGVKPASAYYVVPGQGEERYHAGGYGLLGRDGKPVWHSRSSIDAASELPATRGPFTFVVEGSDSDKAATAVKIYAERDQGPIATIPGVPVGAVAGLAEVVDHVHLIPDAKLLVVLTNARDELRLIPFDPEAALAKTGRPYSLFTSTPPATFTPGKRYVYQAHAVSDKPFKYRIESQPPGMTITPGGLVTWDVPREFASESLRVYLSMRHDNGHDYRQDVDLVRADP